MYRLVRFVRVGRVPDVVVGLFAQADLLRLRGRVGRQGVEVGGRCVKSRRRAGRRGRDDRSRSRAEDERRRPEGGACVPAGVPSRVGVYPLELMPLAPAPPRRASPGDRAHVASAARSDATTSVSPSEHKITVCTAGSLFEGSARPVCVSLSPASFNAFKGGSSASDETSGSALTHALMRAFP